VFGSCFVVLLVLLFCFSVPVFLGALRIAVLLLSLIIYAAAGAVMNAAEVRRCTAEVNVDWRAHALDIPGDA
jgi:hypothetical protein